MKKRITALILAALMLAPTLASCGESEVNVPETETQQTEETAAAPADVTEETEGPSDYDLRQLIPDNLPEKNFDGEEFRIMTDPAEDYISEIISEELNGDACNDAVYNRNVKVEDRFGVAIKAIEQVDPNYVVGTFVKAGTDDAHIAGFKDYLAYTVFMDGSLMNWMEAPYQDLSQPWHNKLANEGATLNNILYAICSDLSITSMTYTYAIFANVDMLADYGYEKEYMYDLVREGTWTLDKLIEMTDGMYVDKNGNGKREVSDIYGYGYYINNPTDVWFTAFGEKVCEYRDDEIVLTYMSDKTVSIYEKLYDWHYNHAGFCIYPNMYDEEQYFLDERLVMSSMRFAAAYTTLRDMNATYTILPIPKWNEEQEVYCTNADDKFTVFGLPLTSEPNLDFVSIIFEALCAESYKQVYPAYYDQALKGKYSSDATAAEMVDLIMAGRAFEFTFQFGGDGAFKGLCYLIRFTLIEQSTAFASKYKSMEKAINMNVPRLLGKVYKFN